MAQLQRTCITSLTPPQPLSQLVAALADQLMPFGAAVRLHRPYQMDVRAVGIVEAQALCLCKGQVGAQPLEA